MAVLEWDKVGERFYETGLDRGLLFTTDGDAHVWNGLTDVNEKTSLELKSFWMDGVKYLDHAVPGAYAATLEAFTYPDILDELTGSLRYADGVYLHDQNASVFHLSYRTKVGNDLDQDLGYKIHIVYNVMALPSGTAFSTISENVEPGKFSWDLSGTPPTMLGARPTSHIHLDSRYVDSTILTTVEGLLYGTEDTDPSLPAMVDLLTMIDSSEPDLPDGPPGPGDWW